MVALLHPNSSDTARSPSARTTDPTGRSTSLSTRPSRPERPALRLVVDNTSDSARSGESAVQARLSRLPFDASHLLTIAAVAVVVFGAFGAIRLIQGAPAVDQSGRFVAGVVADNGAVTAGPTDQVIVAKPGDSLWTIAVSLSPDSDPRPVVAALIEANGGDSVAIGQQIVIPEQLLD
ncbi:MAG: LysM peptidoglycan-binding domain-containing protein [Actinomycetota bacterium]